jgi:hypothetical protein
MIDLDRLLRLRLVVGRYGEMDRAGWWNTRGMLGRHGRMALGRGLPRTHQFAQARVVFAVASARCAELFDPPGGVTLWKLPAVIEDAFEENWQPWLAESGRWRATFERLAASDETDLAAQLSAHGLVSPGQVAAAGALRRSAEGRAVEVPAPNGVDDDLITVLAAGFVKGERQAPAIPYATLVR